MTVKVIQGSFLGGQPKWSSSIQSNIAPPSIRPYRGAPPTAFAGLAPGAPAFAPRLGGPPAVAFAAHPPGPPAPAFAGRAGALQRHVIGAAFPVDAGYLGLASVGGRPLPEVVRGKMESALGADFSNVRVHVGPQAERIGAIAFTIGSDIYFAPGRYQPETLQGQQLLGHELAHVVQQRAGRVSNPLSTGISVVQDRALEAEADRLGRHAAAHRGAPQAKGFSSAAALSRGGLQPIQRMSEGKQVVGDLTRKSWIPSYIDRDSEEWGDKNESDKKDALRGKKAITGKELRILLEGAAEAAWTTYAYHATQSQNVKSIMEKGLDPKRGGTGAAKGDKKFEKESKKRVHYARNRGLAETYERHLEGDTPFGRAHASPAPAEVLQVVIPHSVAAGEEIDPSSRPSDRAYRTKQKIAGKYIRRTEPVPREPSWNDQAWRDHIERALAEHGALLSNMPDKAKKVLNKILKRGLDKATVLQMIKQALRSLDTGDIFDIQKKEDREANPRILNSGMDPTGNFLPLKN